MEQALRSSENLARVQPCLDSLLRTLLSSECKMEVAEEKRKLLINLITRLPLDNLEDRTMQIMSGLCRQGGAGANRACKALMQRLPPATIILKLISQEFLHAKSSRVSNLSFLTTSYYCHLLKQKKLRQTKKYFLFEDNTRVAIKFSKLNNQSHLLFDILWFHFI